MKIKQFNQLFLFFALLGTMFISCQKDAIIETRDTTVNETNVINAAYEANLSTIFSNYGTISNNILDFNSVQSFYAFKEIVQSMNENESTSGIEDAYLELGFSEEDLSDDSDENIPANPILDLFENNLGFVSARQKEEVDLFTFLDNGGDPVDFEDHFVFDEYMKSLINENNEIKVGTRIYRMTDMDQTLVVGNSNLPLFIASRDFEDINYTLYSDLRIIKTKDYKNLFIIDNNYNRTGYQVKVDLSYNYGFIGNATSIQFENTSYVDFGVDFSPSFTWTFSNGYEYTGFEPPVVQFIENDFPITVEVKTTTPSGNPISKTRQIPISPTANPSGPLDCFIEISNPFKIVGNQLIIDYSKLNYFGDGCDVLIGIDGEYFETITWGQTENVTIPLAADCSTIILDPDWNVCTGTKTKRHCWLIIEDVCPEPVTCELTADVKESASKEINNRTWKLVGRLWCGETVWANKMGSRSKSYGQRNNGSWRWKKCDLLCTDNIGTSYFKNKDDECENSFSTIQPHCQESDKFVLEVVKHNKNPRVKPGETASNHVLTQSGQTIELTITL